MKNLKIRCFIDDNEIDDLSAVNMQMFGDDVLEFRFKRFCLTDADIKSSIPFHFTPTTVQQAAVILRNELSKRGELYDCFLASMRSAIDDDFWNTRETCENELDIGQADFDEVAELMLNRIIGLEDKQHGKKL